MNAGEVGEGRGGRSPRQRNVDYWNKRAEDYSRITLETLKQNDDRALHIIDKFVNLDSPLDVADMGTAAGLVAIEFARMGHRVRAIDDSERMVECARRNAEAFNLDVDFVVGDAADPPFEDGSFDLIVARSLLWDMERPVDALARWKALLRPGGVIAIIDGNYYLHLFDDDYREKRHRQDVKLGERSGMHYRYDDAKIDFSEMESIAGTLPLPRNRRPQWDVATLMGLGMNDIHVRSLDRTPYSVFTPNGYMNLPSEFVVVARLPFDGEIPAEHAYDGPFAFDDAALPRIRDRIMALEHGTLQFSKALGDRNRLRIIGALQSGSMTVSQISEVSGCSVSLTSHNLKVLKGAGIVSSDRGGKGSLYFLTDPYRMRRILRDCVKIHGCASDGPEGGGSGSGGTERRGLQAVGSNLYKSGADGTAPPVGQ